MSSSGIFPPEIVNIILLNLELKDLLNARLVSTPWNKESLRVLGNSKFRISLKDFGCLDNSLETFIEFAPDFILPFKISYSHIISGNLQIEQGLKTLFNLYGSTCLREIELFSSLERSEFYPQILQILTSVSEGLEFLKISISCSPDFQNQGLGQAENLFVNHESLNLQNLKKLSLIMANSRPIGSDETFWRGLIERSPNLKELDVDIPESTFYINPPWYWPFPLGESSKLCKVESLKMMKIPKSMLYDSAPQIYFPGPSHVKRLELATDYGVSDLSDRMNGILAFCATSLERLTLKIVIPSYLRGQRPRFIAVKPTVALPKLIELKIKVTPFPTLIIDPEFLPALELIEIPHDSQFDGKQRLHHERVKWLSLRVKPGDIPIPTNTNGYKDHMEGFQKLFPNLNKICIINDMIGNDSDQVGSGMIKYVIKGIAQSAGASNIKEIELIDCYENYLVEALTSNPNPTRLILKNFRREGTSTDVALFKALTQLVGETKLEIYERKRINEHGAISTCLIVHEKERNVSDIQMKNLRKIRFSISDKAKWNFPNGFTNTSELNLGDMIECYSGVCIYR